MFSRRRHPLNLGAFPQGDIDDAAQAKAPLWREEMVILDNLMYTYTNMARTCVNTHVDMYSTAR